MTLLLPAVCIFACLLSLVFVAKKQHKLALKAKLLASLCFVGFAWDLGAWSGLYGQLIFIGLLLSMVGDWLLAGPKKKSFMFGIGAFLAAHLTFLMAFLNAGTEIGIATEKLPLIIAVVMIAMLCVFLWLRDHLEGTLKSLVPMYLTAIGLMLIGAWGNEAAAAWWWIVGGATLFAVSDLFVARNRFIKTATLNRILGLPIYYVAQLMLAYSVSLI